MDKTSIELIRDLADNIADYITRTNDVELFDVFAGARGYEATFNALMRAATHAPVAGLPPVVGFDQFIYLFSEDEDEFDDWRHVADLVTIRLVEQLWRNGWLQEHAEEVLVDG
jgi:hypothetical protein